MKLYKRIIGIFLTIVFISNSILCPINSLDNLTTGDSDSNLSESKVYHTATIDDDFADDRLIVVFKKVASAKLKDYNREEFPEISVSNVTDLTQSTKTELKQRQATYEANGIQTSRAQIIQETYGDYKQIISLELSTPGKQNVLNAIKALESREDILYVGPDYRINVATTPFNDRYYGEQWAIEKIQLPEAWNITTGSSSVVVGVIDTGIDGNHEDLASNINSSLSRDFSTGEGKVVSIPTDPFGHGTLVAGIIGAGIEGTTGVSGVCWDVQLVSLRIFDDDGEGYSSYAVNAIDYATAKNIPLLNLSACWYEDWENYDSPMNIVISNYPGLLICAAGNYESNNDNGNIYPASLNLPNVITVANSTAADVLLANVYDAYGNPRGSNYGASTVHLAAPGTGIKCCYPGNNYGTTDGTSLSAPYVTGVAALIMSIRPDLSATEVKKLILDNVDHVEALEGKCITGGRLNAYKAVLAATQSQTLTGDVNGDNRADMILSRNINGKRALTVFLGKADGSFTEPITTNSTRTFIYYDPAFTGDFDGDGLTDVVFHWRDYDTHKRRFIVYRSKGDGTFYDAVQLSCTLTHEPQQYPCTFHVDDVDGDGQDDFIIVQKNTSGNYGAWVYRGTSQSPYLINTTTCELSSNKAYSTANTVHTGDFNGDGRADILVQRSSSTNTNVSGMRQLIVYLGNTDGSFNEGSMLTSVRAFDLATYPSQFFVSDMNGDGKDDFVVHWKNDSGKRTNIVYKGASYASYLVDSSTNALATFHTYSEENPVYVGDVNGDGREDMIVHWSSEGKRQLWVYPANADGTYSSGSNTATVNAYNPALYADEYFVEDVNGDGREDFIVKWKNTDGRVSFVTYLGTTSGTFTAAVRTEPVANIPYYNFGNTYRITNAGAVKCLNVYGDNVTTINNNQNVCVWTNSGTLEQRWVIGFIGDGTYIRSAIDTDFGLHASGTGSPWNCDLYQIAGNEAYTQVDFIATSGGAYRIKLHNYDLYLTASSTEEGANVYWTSFIATERQAWYVTCV